MLDTGGYRYYTIGDRGAIMTTEKPKKGALTTPQIKELRRGYWTDSEIRQLNLSKSPDGTPQNFNYNSATFRQARDSRAKWGKELISRGWRRKEVLSRVEHYYDLKGGRTPWDWLKLSYSPTKKVTSFADSVKRKIRSRADRTLGRGYGKRKLPETRIVHLAAFPKRPPRPMRRKLGPRLPIRGPASA